VEEVNHMRMPWYARAGVVAAASVAAIFVATPSAFAAVPLTKISSDTFTNSTSAHATQVEPDTYSFGSTIVMATQTGRFNDGGASDIAYSTSTNNGATWSGGNLPGITKFAGGGPYDRVSDPAVAYDAKHNVWLISTLPLLEAGGVHGAAIVTSRSTNGGVTFGNPVTVATGGDLDKNWIACDNTSTSPFYGNCYTEWDDHGTGNTIKMSTSSDGGLTWGAAKNTASNNTGIGGQPVVQPNGTVIVPMASATETSIRAFRSTNGGSTWGSAVTISAVSKHTVAGGLRTGPLPSAEIDSAGKVYVVWQDCRFRTSCASNDIVMSTSTDGATWTTVVRIPIDATSSTVDHFIPGLAVDKTTSGATARLGLTYYLYPVRNCTAATCQLKVGFVSSTNGGTTWTAPTDVAGPMTLSWLAPTTQGPMVGDYISTSFGSDGKAHAAFAVANTPSGSVRDEAIYTTSTGLTAASGTVAVNTYAVPQPADAFLGDLADQAAIALGVQPIG
jgi:hypothetical protein